MKRSAFIRNVSILGAGTAVFSSSQSMSMLMQNQDDQLMPVLFMGHGNPMNAISDNPYTRTWTEIAKDVPKPRVILVLSAHWETRGTRITAVPNPKMIYDMYGFPEELYRVQYPCPGDPELARRVEESVGYTEVMPDMDWGLDHGAWSLLVKMFPDADIPCLQLSLNRTREMKWHYELGKELSALRKCGVLIIGSGNIVHNLQYAQFGRSEPYEWATEFDEYVKRAIDERNHGALINYSKFGKAAELSVNSAEHYIPMLYTLALQQKEEEVKHFNESIDFGSGSMRCLRIG